MEERSLKDAATYLFGQNKLPLEIVPDQVSVAAMQQVLASFVLKDLLSLSTHHNAEYLGAFLARHLPLSFFDHIPGERQLDRVGFCRADEWVSISRPFWINFDRWDELLDTSFGDWVGQEYRAMPFKPDSNFVCVFYRKMLKKSGLELFL
jgi:hypothetical protein